MCAKFKRREKQSFQQNWNGSDGDESVCHSKRDFSKMKKIKFRKKRTRLCVLCLSDATLTGTPMRQRSIPNK